MFSSTPQQFLSIQNAAARHGRATGDWRPMIRSIVIHHILGPAMYKAIETMFMAALGRPPEEDEWKEWIAFMILGPYSGAYIGRFLLSFTFSFDDFIIAFFVAGANTTLPIYIFSSIRRGITPEVNAIGTMVLAASLILLMTAQFLLRKRTRR